MQRIQKLIIAGTLLMLTACGVPEDKHNAVVKDLENTKLALAETQAAKEKSEAELNGKITATEKKIAELEKTRDFLSEQLSESNASLSMYESKTGGLEAALAATKAELDELRKQKMRQEKRLAEFRKLSNQLAELVKMGKVKIKIRNGNMTIELANNILFDSGKTKIKPDGMSALADLADILKTFPERNFLVAGHTDDDKINNKRFDSNWDLSTARAVEVVEHLQKSGLPPTQLAAAGYGEFDPVAPNDSKEGKALNRRIEIIVMPNLDELPKLGKES